MANYKINLVDVSDIGDLSVYHSDLREVLGFVKCRDSKKALLEYANTHKNFFEAVDYETVNAIGAMVQGGEQYVKMIRDGKKEEKVNMCKALEELWEDGVKTGEARGEARGIRKAVLLLRRVGT